MRRVGVEIFQHLFAPLDQSHRDIEAREELCELHADRASPQHDERFRQVSFKSIVARKIACGRELRQRWVRDN